MDNQLRQNVDKLNELLGDVAYLSFSLKEVGYTYEGRIMGEYNAWRGYASKGRVGDVKQGRAITPAPVDLKGVKIDEGEFKQDYLGLALSGGHVDENGWDLFYHSSECPVFLFGRYGRDVNYADVETALYVLSGRDNIQRVIDTRKQLVKERADLPDYVWERLSWQEPEKKVENPAKQVSNLDVFERAGWPPNVEELELYHLPKLLDGRELEEAVREINEQAQGSLF